MWYVTERGSLLIVIKYIQLALFIKYFFIAPKFINTKEIFVFSIYICYQ